MSVLSVSCYTLVSHSEATVHVTVICTDSADFTKPEPLMFLGLPIKAF